MIRSFLAALTVAITVSFFGWPPVVHQTVLDDPAYITAIDQGMHGKKYQALSIAANLDEPDLVVWAGCLTVEAVVAVVLPDKEAYKAALQQARADGECFFLHVPIDAWIVDKMTSLPALRQRPEMVIFSMRDRGGTLSYGWTPKSYWTDVLNQH